MSCQISSFSQEQSLTSRGLASVDRWEGLKEWHRKHQELLQSRANKDEGTTSDSHPPAANNLTDSVPGCQNEIQNFGMAKPGQPGPLKHDLSIISEGDEDSRAKDNAKGIAEIPELGQKLNSKFPSITRKSEKLLPLSTVSMNEARNPVSVKVEMQSKKNDCNTKRPFLRRGQGLVRYNLQPEDVMNPYRKCASKKTKTQDLPRKSDLQRFTSKKVDSHPTSASNRNLQTKESCGRPLKPASVLCLSAPIQHLTLTSAPRSHQHSAVGTWSQVFGSDEKRLPTNPALRTTQSDNYAAPVNKEPTSLPKLRSTITEGAALSSQELVQHKNSSLVDEEQESLAAYVDLEQHVGNASFCSTSSKVDRLVAKSSQTIHPSNPDAITQSKPQSPSKINSEFSSRGCASKGGVHNNNVWTASDLENLLKSRNWHWSAAGDLGKRTPVPAIASAQCNSYAYSDVIDSTKPNDNESPSSKESAFGTCSNDITSILNQIGLARKPHLMKTMPSIDLDSSLVKNGLTTAAMDRFTEFDAGSDSSSSSTDSDSENSTSSESSIRNNPVSKIQEIPLNPLHYASVTNIPNKFVPTPAPFDPVILEGINKQIETHLDDLRKEIKSLQDAKSKSQKYVSSLEKKIQEFEHKIILEARSSSKRLEEEKQMAEKKLLEEQAKFLKEKQALQKTIREQRKHLSDPVAQQDLMRLKQEVAQWEEKWRADRAKARGQESNLRIQITNLKRENEKLKDEANKLRREKETAVNAAKAKAATNTRVINSIAQQLGKNKRKASLFQEEKSYHDNAKVCNQPAGSQHSAYSLKPVSTSKTPVTTIGTFPNPSKSLDEWASEEEIDLGKGQSEDEDSVNNTENEEISEDRSKRNIRVDNNYLIQDEIHLKKNGVANGDSVIELTDSTIEEAQARYDALFGTEDVSVSSPISNHTKSSTESAPELETLNSHRKDKHEDFVKTIYHQDGKVEQLKKSGTRVITHPDGTWEQHSASGSVMTVPSRGWPIHISYFNGDQLEKLEDGTVRYFYAKTNVWQTTFPDGREEMRYPSGQVEQRAKDGTSKVTYPAPFDTSAHKSSEEFNSPQGLRVQKDINGDTVILLPNGERELHTNEYMRKDFLDGTVKFVFGDGSQETRYPSGRIRIRDCKGNLIKDTALLS